MKKNVSIQTLDLILFKEGKEEARISLDRLIKMSRKEFRAFWKQQRLCGRDDFRFRDRQGFERSIPALYHMVLDKWEECKKETHEERTESQD